jgi:RimJ/RimL family protein N-acetyltransferase
MDDLGLQELTLDGPRLRALPASAGHAAQLQECLEAALDYFVRTEGRRPRPDEAAQLIADAEADPQRRVYALLPHESERAVGVLDLHLDYPEPGTVQIGLLLFREACQGRGYGRETCAALEDTLRRTGYRALRLSVVDENPDAKAFWERLGFWMAGRLDRGVTVYEKAL